jgi:hypothetical protein
MSGVGRYCIIDQSGADETNVGERQSAQHQSLISSHARDYVLRGEINRKANAGRADVEAATDSEARVENLKRT